MANYKITPTNIKTGNTAPYFVVRIENEHEVQRVADSLSTLFQFPNWEPSISKLRSFRKTKRR